MARRGGIGGATLLITALASTSALFGFGRDIVIAAVYGAGPELDAYFVAQGFMNLVLGLLASAMAKAMVPVTARQVSSGNRRAAAHTVTVALSVTLVVLGLATILMWLLAGGIVTALAPGFGPEQAELATTMTRIVLVATVLVAGTNLLAAAANAHRSFFWSSVQGIPFNIVMIVAAAVFGPEHGIVALAWGFVAGSLARFACQLIPLRSLGIRLRLAFDTRDKGFREMATLVPPLLLGSAIGNVNTLVDRAVGSAVGEGAISGLSYAWRVVSLGETLLVASLVTALYPAFAAASEDRPELRRLVGRGLTTVSVVLAPITVALLVCAHPLVTAVFERGSFDAADTAVTATAVAWYAPSLIALGWREIALRASYAVSDTRAPVLVSVAAVIVNVIGDLTLGLAFGVPGLAASTTASLVLAAAANTWLLARRHSGVQLRPLVGVVTRALVAGLLAAVAGGLLLRVGDSWPSLLTVAVTGPAVCVVFAATLFALRAPETAVLREALALVRRR